MRITNEPPNPIGPGQSEIYANGLAQLSTQQFTAAFTNYWIRYSSMFYNPKLPGNLVYGLNPPLSVLRGMVVVLDDFSSRSGATSQFGLNYSRLTAQDNYTINDNWDLYTKWTEVKAALQTAVAGSSPVPSPASAASLYINYLSASGGSFPYFVASGKSNPATNAPQLMTGEVSGIEDTFPDFPTVNCFLGFCSVEFLGTNGLTSNYWSQQNTTAAAGRAASAATGATHPVGYGMVMADFPGELLISQLINVNFTRN
jgi:1-phosphatidylinositol phosphodiesterase